MTTNTITTYPTRTLGVGTPLVFAGETAPRRDLMEPVRNVGFHKPRGGLWTCPLGGYTWREWCLDERYKEPEELIEHTLTVEQPAVVAVIDSLADLEAILAAHSVPNPYPYGPVPNRFIDFESLTREVDGVWLTEQGQWATRWTKPGLYGWDLESVLLFRWIF